jgi:Secretory lipase
MAAIADVLTLNRLGVASAPQTPIYDYHIVTDEVVPVGQDNDTMQSWRARGANLAGQGCEPGGPGVRSIQQVRDLVGEHAKEAGLRLHSVVGFYETGSRASLSRLLEASKNGSLGLAGLEQDKQRLPLGQHGAAVTQTARHEDLAAIDPVDSRVDLQLLLHRDNLAVIEM